MFLTTAEVTLAVGSLTAFSGIGGILLGGRVQARRDREDRMLELGQERKRWEREDRLERERAARKNRAAWADKRLAANAAFAQATRELILWAQGGWSAYKSAEGSDGQGAISEFVSKASLVIDALSELEFFCSPELRKLADEVNLASREAGARAVGMLSQENDEERVQSWSEACENAISQRYRYIELAQEEIGLLEGRTASSDPVP